MAKTTKPTKQQVAQAKARAGGNNPVKVTNAGLKRLGGAAVIAASMTPVGRGAKIAVTAAKAAKAAKTANTAAKAKEVAKTAKIASNSVKTRPEDKIKRLRDNVDSYYKTVKAKSGATAKQDAAEAAKTNYRNSPYKENQVVTVRSANVKPYKTTGGAGSTARRASEMVSKKNLKNTKPMQNVPKDVSDRFNATVKRLAAEEAKKKKK
jgi:hypothetical protein